jgi:uncharacterized damage-inducible protein DinB
MTSTATSPSSSTPLTAAARTPRQQFLDAYEREHAITKKVIGAFPKDRAELRPHPKLKTARELAWVFVLERGLGEAVLANAFATRGPTGGPPPAPESWDEVVAALEHAHAKFRDTLNSYTDEQLLEPVKFFTGPGQLADIPRLDLAWFLLHDQIHHRGQLSIYLRIADAKVPSIYGPSGDEPWF